MTRKYDQKKRATQTAHTRERIVQATVALHGSVGPAQTTVSAIAQRAGVRRATVYEHFPDERAIFEACTGHFFTDHPPPDYRLWEATDDPVARLWQALEATYAYYEQTGAMLTLVYRDSELKPVMWEVPAAQAQARHWQAAHAAVLAGWLRDTAQPQERQRLAAAIGHALDFQTWHSLVRRQGLTNPQAVELMVGLVRCAAARG